MLVKKNNIGAIRHTLELAMGRPEGKNIVVFGEDVGKLGGVFRATKNLQESFGEKRCFDTPIAEASLAGVAVGMAINGLKPVVEIQFSGFVFPALQNLFCHAARYRNRTRGRFTCPLVVRMPVGAWKGALEHHSESLEALFAHTPGLKVIVPSSPSTTKGLLLSALKSKDPVIFLEPLMNYYEPFEEIENDYYEIPIGKARIINHEQIKGKVIDLTIVSYGATVFDCLKAISLFNQEQVKTIELIDLLTINPWDEETVITSVRKSGRLLVVHEAIASFSVSSEIIAKITEKCLFDFKCPPERVTGYDVVIPLEKGQQFFLVSPEKIVAKIKKMFVSEY